MFSMNDAKRILKESRKYNVMLLFMSQEEAMLAANEFRKAIPESVINTKDKTVLRTIAGFCIYFKSIQHVKRQIDGIRARIIICIPLLEYMCVHKDGVCTIKQLREQEEL